jgi:hypothetical protein
VCSVTPPDHFHITVRTSAYPRRYPRLWLLAGSHPTRHAVGTSSWPSMRARVRFLRSQLPLLASVGRCAPPGFSAVHTGQCGRLPAPYPVPFWLQRVSLLRWVSFTMAHHTFACAAHRCVLDGIPGLRLPGSAVSPRFKPLRTSRGPGGYAVTPAPGGRDLHPHDKLSYEVKEFLFTSRSTRKPWLPFDQRVAPPQTPY